MPPDHQCPHVELLSFGTFLFAILLILVTFPSISFCFPSSSTPPSISPRFLHFSIQIRPEWLLDIENKILGVFESVEEGPNGWQIVVQLYANQPTQSMPFTSSVNISQGHKAIRVDRIGECESMEGNIKSIQLEIELSKQFIYVRAKNAAKYAIPTPLMESADLRVYFVRIEGEGNTQKSCQLNSEMDTKETSRFALPSTTPHPAFINKNSTTPTPPNPIKSTTNTPSTSSIPNGNSPIWNATIVEEEDTENEGGKILALPKDGNEDEMAGNKKPFSEWPLYKRKRIKVPRRSTMAAQRFLSPNHYVPQQDWARGRQKQQQRMFPPRPTPAWNYGGIGEEILSTTMASYIDIIRDRQLYEEVQRSRTMEINSRWSFIFLLFMGLIAVLISISAAFALIMFILLQCRPKPKKPLLVA